MGIGRTIGEIAKSKQISLRKLAIQADLPYNTVYSIVKRDSSSIRADALTKIAEVLNVSLYELISSNTIQGGNNGEYNLLKDDNTIALLVNDKDIEDLKNAGNSYAGQLPEELYIIKKQMNAVGYDLIQVNNNLFFIGENGAYKINAQDIKNIQNQSNEYISFLLYKLNKKLFENAAKQYDAENK